VQDPHFWLDPVLAQKIVTNIRDGLAKADPSNKDYYARNASAYNAKLAQLDTDYRQGLANCSIHTVISSHDAFSYLGRRYGLTIASIAGLSPDEEPSAGKLAELSRLVRDQGITYVFFESLVSPRLADTIAAETNAKTLVFDPVEGLSNEDQKQGKNYLSVQRENLANLRTALACQ
jgi:zinc transport system substrate-binding protein